MPRGIKNQPAPVAVQAPAKETPMKLEKDALETRIKPTKMNHVFFLDIHADGKYREVAIVKLVKNPDGRIRSVYYIDVALMDNVDKGRIKALVTDIHADKYELWDLMSQKNLSNGKNALDYFHQVTRVIHGPGAVTGGFGSGLAGVTAEGSNIVGSDFTDPGSGALETQPVK